MLKSFKYYHDLRGEIHIVQHIFWFFILFLTNKGL